MAISFIFIVVLIHRIGVIFLAISSVVITILPNIFDQEIDYEFASNAYVGLLRFCKIGLLMLIVSGLIRLTFSIPEFIIVKLFFVLIVISLVFFKKVSYNNNNFMFYSLLRVISVIVTATVGLLI